MTMGENPVIQDCLKLSKEKQATAEVEGRDKANKNVLKPYSGLKDSPSSANASHPTICCEASILYSTLTPSTQSLEENWNSIPMKTQNQCEEDIKKLLASIEHIRRKLVLKVANTWKDGINQVNPAQVLHKTRLKIKKGNSRLCYAATIKIQMYKK